MAEESFSQCSIKVNLLFYGRKVIKWCFKAVGKRFHTVKETSVQKRIYQRVSYSSGALLCEGPYLTQQGPVSCWGSEGPLPGKCVHSIMQRISCILVTFYVKQPQNLPNRKTTRVQVFLIHTPMVLLSILMYFCPLDGFISQNVGHTQPTKAFLYMHILVFRYCLKP